jgi:hypothetical protein
VLEAEEAIRGILSVERGRGGVDRRGRAEEGQDRGRGNGVGGKMLEKCNVKILTEKGRGKGWGSGGVSW